MLYAVFVLREIPGRCKAVRSKNFDAQFDLDLISSSMWDPVQCYSLTSYCNIS